MIWLQSGVGIGFGGGFGAMLTSFARVFATSAFPAGAFVIVGCLFAPKPSRRVRLATAALSLVVSAGVFQLVRHQNSAPVFWLSSLLGLLAGAIVGFLAVEALLKRRASAGRDI